MSAGEPAFDDLLEGSPTNLRDRRGSVHTVSSGLAARDKISAEPHPAANSVVTPPVQDEHQGSIICAPALSELPRLHIDRQSANISGYAPGSLSQWRHSTASTPGIAFQETYFEDSYGPRSIGDEDTPSPPRLKRRLAISFFGFFCTGWSDGSACIIKHERSCAQFQSGAQSLAWYFLFLRIRTTLAI
ncbi:hypothetical protein FS749_004473 [Ceratobasidium sp. UAMH 11750]|nr:hypothetical protein FS749_004473 [Ceratobasidium sp. UAMH 11750]